MSNKNRGEISIEIGKTEYVMRPSFQAICSIEGELNKSILDVLVSLSEKRLKLSEMVSVVKHGVSAYHANFNKSEADIGKDIYEAGLINIMPQIVQFLERAVGIQSKEE